MANKDEPTHFTNAGNRKFQTNGPQDWTAGFLEIAELLGEEQMGPAIRAVLDFGMERLDQVKDQIRQQQEQDRKHAEREAAANKKPAARKVAAAKDAPAEKKAAKPRAKRTPVVRGPQAEIPTPEGA